MADIVITRRDTGEHVALATLAERARAKTSTEQEAPVLSRAALDALGVPESADPHTVRLITDTLAKRAEAFRPTDSRLFDPTLLSDMATAPPPPLLLDRLDPGEPTILYGPGGIGKGALTAWWIVQLARAGGKVLILDYENHGTEWARRIEGLGGREARESVSYIAPLTFGLGAIWDHAGVIRDTVAAREYTYVVIDSAVMACAGQDATDPTVVSRFFAAVQCLNVPSLTLAHVTKLHDTRYPFGSVFWHNLARVTWAMMPKGEDVLLSCQKANNYLRPAASTVTTTWFDGWLREVNERRAIVTLTERIIEVLGDGPQTVAAITAALNDGIPKDEHTHIETVRNAVKRELRRGESSRVTVADGAWRLRETEE